MTEGAQNTDMDDRQYARLVLGVPATLETLDARLRIEIVDISQGGAHVLLPNDDAFAKDCLLVWLRFEAFGTVIWRKGAHIGIVFEKPLSHTTIFETRKNAASILEQEAAKIENEARSWAQGARRL